MWRCPSITSWFGTNEALPCRKVWVSLDNQGTSSPQLSCGCSGREEKGKQQGVQHILSVPDIPGPSVISSSFYQQEFVSPPPDRSEILVLPSLFLPSSTFIFQHTSCSPCSWLGFGSRLSLAREVGFPLCQDSLLGSSRAWRV